MQTSLEQQLCLSVVCSLSFGPSVSSKSGKVCFSLQSLYGSIFWTINNGMNAHVSGCSLPLGMQRRLILNNQISASTFRESWRNTWHPYLARLNQDGSANAWRPRVPPEILIQIFLSKCISHINSFRHPCNLLSVPTPQIWRFFYTTELLTVRF